MDLHKGTSGKALPEAPDPRHQSDRMRDPANLVGRVELHDRQEPDESVAEPMPFPSAQGPSRGTVSSVYADESELDIWVGVSGNAP
jgi:hypothetical protein